MAVNGVEIKVGQKWKTRGGEIVEVVNFDRDSIWPWDLSNGGSVTDEGFEQDDDDDPSEWDIVELVEDNQLKFTVDEFFDALRKAPSTTRSDIEKYLMRKSDPEYEEYVRLKAKFED